MAEIYRLLGAELEHHFSNGSEFLHLEPDGADSPPEVVALRFKVLEREANRMFRRAGKLDPRNPRQ